MEHSNLKVWYFSFSVETLIDLIRDSYHLEVNFTFNESKLPIDDQSPVWEVHASLNQGSDVLNFNQLIEAAIVVTFEFPETHCKRGLIFDFDIYFPLFEPGTVYMATFGIIPKKLCFN